MFHVKVSKIGVWGIMMETFYMDVSTPGLG